MGAGYCGRRGGDGAVCRVRIVVGPSRTPRHCARHSASRVDVHSRSDRHGLDGQRHCAERTGYLDHTDEGRLEHDNSGYAATHPDYARRFRQRFDHPGDGRLDDHGDAGQHVLAVRRSDRCRASCSRRAEGGAGRHVCPGRRLRDGDPDGDGGRGGSRRDHGEPHHLRRGRAVFPGRVVVPRCRPRALNRPAFARLLAWMSRLRVDVRRVAPPTRQRTLDHLVETRGIEPLTPALQRRCSAN